MNRKINRLLFFFGIFILLFVLFFWLFNFINYVHETGHMVFGFADGLIKGQTNSYSITSWVKSPFTPSIPLPQQTKIVSGGGSANFALGGPLFNMLIFLFLSFVGYNQSKKWYWFLLFFDLALFEISGNIICGTDNLTGGPLSMCHPSLNLFILLFAISFFAIFFALISTKELWKRI